MSSFYGKKIHFIGVGGASMSALAEFALAQGGVVSGSDRTESAVLDKLSKLGAEVYAGSRADIINGVDIVVYSSAVPFDDPELAAAFAAGKLVFERQEFLSAVAEMFSTVVAVAGTHGKTTVTAMIAHVLKTCGIPFVAHIGGEPVGMDNLTIERLADGSIPRDIFLTEACEYKRHLLALHPSLAVVTNMECDHPDCYSDLDEVYDVFSAFLEKCPVAVVRCQDKFICPNAHICIREDYGVCAETEESERMDTERIHKYTEKETTSIGANRKSSAQTENNADKVAASGSYGGANGSLTDVSENKPNEQKAERNVAEEITYPCKDICSYVVLRTLECKGGQTVTYSHGTGTYSFFLPLKGKHMRDDAMLALAASCVLGVSQECACAALATFGGVKRRYERAGKLSGAEVIFDYAHHPTEIACTLSVAATEGKFLTVFQPHTYSRTARYMDDFVNVLGRMEHLVIMPTYAAREKGAQGADSVDLAREIKRKFPECKLYLSFSHDDTAEYIKNTAAGYDAVLMLGAGDIYRLKDILPLVR